MVVVKLIMRFCSITRCLAMILVLLKCIETIHFWSQIKELLLCWCFMYNNYYFDIYIFIVYLRYWECLARVTKRFETFSIAHNILQRWALGSKIYGGLSVFILEDKLPNVMQNIFLVLSVFYPIFIRFGRRINSFAISDISNGHCSKTRSSATAEKQRVSWAYMRSWRAVSLR